MSRLIDQIENELMKKDVPEFDPGDTVVVQVRVTEGDHDAFVGLKALAVAFRDAYLDDDGIARIELRDVLFHELVFDLVNQSGHG